MSWRSGSFQLKTVANKNVIITSEQKSINFVMVNRDAMKSSYVIEKNCGVVLLGIIF